MTFFINRNFSSVLSSGSFLKCTSGNSLINLLSKRSKSNGINVSNYETGFNSSKAPADPSIVEELDLLSMEFEPKETDNKSYASSSRGSDSPSSRSSRNPNRSVTSKYPTGGVAKQRCYNCGQIGHVSFDCQQPQVRKACYTCGNSGHLARDCPQSQRPVICYVCRQPGHLASKCPTSPNGQFRSNSNKNNKNDNENDN